MISWYALLLDLALGHAGVMKTARVATTGAGAWGYR
ncbi:uncharacterized protein DNG_01637 [Cephalotrichum gorgonifer]|uniref:Uncharacterized protein n=1 Tax=Cephalotrichum gorgonifer TaxID=2041049 RepID=A0AAE8MRB1_9PEZI|nr:uncharacterized protein DNG_01637 [Cephalotrichum gorgonifer]